MANKNENETQIVLESNEVLVLQPKRVLNKSEFTLLSDLVRSEQKKSGVKIVLIPNSADIVEFNPEVNEEEAKAKEEAEAKAKAEEEQKAKEEAEAKAKAEEEQKAKEEAEAKAEEKKKTEAKSKSEKTDK